ncbi:MAG: alpha/beta hydrolase family protein [Gemmatimonadaceae bacterium]
MRPIAILLLVAAAARLPAQDTVIVESGGLKLRALLWRPAGNGPFPGVIYNHGSGPNMEMQRPATVGPVFASHGYVLLYLFRRGSGLSAKEGSNGGVLMDRANAEKGLAARNELQLRLLESELEEVMAGIAFLRGRRDVNAKRIAVAGHSFGGALNLLAAERDSTLRAVVLFGGAARSWPGSTKLQQRLIEAVRHTRTPVFFAYAANDYSIEPAKILGGELEKLGRPYRAKIYPAFGSTAGEGHNFVYGSVAAWERDVFAFLAEHMR